jgi:hypothetical protein
VIEKNHFYKILSREMVVNSTPEMDSLILGIKKQNLSIIKQIIAVGKKRAALKRILIFLYSSILYLEQPIALLHRRDIIK